MLSQCYMVVSSYNLGIYLVSWIIFPGHLLCQMSPFAYIMHITVRNIWECTGQLLEELSISDLHREGYGLSEPSEVKRLETKRQTLPKV